MVTFLGKPVQVLVQYTLNGKTYVQVELHNGSTGDIRVDDERLVGYKVVTQ